MSWIKNSLLLTALFVLAGCASAPPVVYQPVRVPPLPVEIATKREANLTDRLTKLLMPNEQPLQQSQQSSQMVTGQSTSSTPASTPTQK